MALFAKSASVRYSTDRECPAPVLGTYVDDIFGGFPHNKSLSRALDFRRYLYETGASLTIVFNMKPSKTPMPARQQVILGCLYDSTERRVKTAEKKRVKYLARIRAVRRAHTVSVKDILQLHGNLNYAAGVCPFGRPFLATLTGAIRGREGHQSVVVTEPIKSALRIWDNILTANTGLTFSFVLGNLPRCPDDIFVDASTE